ncbi:MAG TPA: orotidine-5'-phosphate decarboxylase [Candidatus Omnitrophota bacterium]|nr:orotidine-5'-phosphate decarboxylase [Candidatus Omnitrophota bacterium]HQO37326.1 orotidine-5'-phosphate decarboxylase [Candidatus Omnitrophota bacterium]HQQ05771.1 orotidine-5'-phosphate decarboxylase [Candidatus Omnitrophota bacterium]
MQDIKDKLIVALDVHTLKEAERFVKILVPAGVRLFKIGSHLFTAYGPETVKMVGKRGGKVFLDLKFHDIPNTVQNACYTSTGTGSVITFASAYSYITSLLAQNVKNAVQYPVFMLTVHAMAGIETLRNAKKGAEEKAKELHIPRPLIVGVTVLTSENLGGDTLRVVLERARNVKESGLDGVVCSAQEARAVREAIGKDFIIVTPGIRAKGADAGDQKRIATAQDALAAGANYIVVGRPILGAKDPVAAIKNIIKE